MKKKLFGVMLLLFTVIFASKAQPTLTSANNPVAGESYYYRVTDTIAQPGPGGTGVDWNFTGVQVTLNTVILNYVTPASTPYASSFPGANLASYVLPGDYNYYTTTASGLVFNGRANPGETDLISGSNYLLLSYPLSYGDNITNNITGTSSVANITGTVNVHADGTGNLRLPAITFSNVLRVKVTEDITFSFGPGVDQFVHTESYYWYSADYRGPVMRIIISNTSGISSAYSKIVGVADFTLGLTNNARPSLGNLNVSPSPATTSAQVRLEVLESGSMDFTLLDISGKEVQRWSATLAPGTYTRQLDLADLPRGIYLLAVRGEGISREQRIVLE